MIPGGTRVALFINNLQRGGAETQFLRVAKALRAAGYEVRIFTLLPENDFGDELDGLDVHLLAPRPGPGTFVSAARALRAWRPAVVLDFLYQATLVGRFAAVAARVPVVLSSMRNEKLESRARTEVFRRTAWTDAVVVANSHRTGEVLVGNGTVPARKIRVIPNGLTPPVPAADARAKVRADLGVDDGTFLYLGVGRLTAQKDWPTLVRAVSVYRGPPARWVIAGEGAGEDDLQAQLAAAGLADVVTLLGLRGDVPDLLAACDAVVLSSTYEGMPNVVLEAMAVGRPAVTTDVGACRELLGDGDTAGGLIVAAQDPAALARAMAELVARPADRRAAMGARNAALVRAEYSLAAADRRWTELLSELLAELTGEPTAESTGELTGGPAGSAGARVSVFLPTLDGGGAERVTLSLCSALQDRGHDVELVLGESRGSLVGAVPAGLPVVDLGRPRVITSVGPLRRHLLRRRPDVVVSVLTHASVVAAAATKLRRRRTRLIVMHHNTTSLSLRNSARRRDRLLPLLSSVAYRAADAIVAVSDGVADDLAAETGIARSRIRVLPNPIEYDRIAALAREPLDPALVPPGDGPLLLAAGRLTRQKNFTLLLDAFAKLPGDFRLALLGDGEDRADLEAKATRLGVADRVAFGGFVANPYPVFRAADVYVLSSDWEGLPTVLLECLFFDLGIVSTDCRSGPRQILEDGRHGALVPVGDADALAAAVETAGRGPRPSAGDRWRRYDAPVVAAALDELIRGVVSGSRPG